MEKESETEGVIEFTTREEIINSSVNAMNAASEYNALTKEDQIRRKNIMDKCFAIIECYVNEIYDEVFVS